MCYVPAYNGPSPGAVSFSARCSRCCSAERVTAGVGGAAGPSLQRQQRHFTPRAVVADRKTNLARVRARYASNKKNEDTVLPREVGRAATVVRCQGGNAKAAMPLYSKRALAMVGSAHSPATQTNRGPRSQGLPIRRSTMGKARAPSGSVRLEGCIQDGGLG